MTFEEFKKSTDSPNPPSHLTSALTALWYEMKGNWNRAHDFADGNYSLDCYWVHAYLHRVEGDKFNAGYWYRRANKTFPSQSLDDERDSIIQELLSA